MTMGMFQEPLRFSWWKSCKNTCKLVLNLLNFHEIYNIQEISVLHLWSQACGVRELLSDWTKRDISWEVQVVQHWKRSKDKQSGELCTCQNFSGASQLIKNPGGGSCQYNYYQLTMFSLCMAAVCLVKSIENDPVHSYSPNIIWVIDWKKIF